MEQQKKYDVFISYSRKDFDEVNAFVEMLKQRIPTLDIWFDLDGIESGDEFRDKIISAIKRSKYVLFALSKNSDQSQWTRKELGFAKGKGIKIIPVLLRGAHLQEMDWFLFEFSGVDCIDIVDQKQIDKLIKNLAKWTKKNCIHIQQQEEPNKLETIQSAKIQIADVTPKYKQFKFGIWMFLALFLVTIVAVGIYRQQKSMDSVPIQDTIFAYERKYSLREEISKVLKENVILNYDSIDSYLKSSYYDLRSTFATMPATIYNKLEPAIAELKLVDDISLRLLAEEYESRSPKQMNKINNILNLMGKDVVFTKLKVAEQESELATNTNPQAKIEETYKKVEETYNNLSSKCKLNSNDEIHVQWYKIVLFGDFLYTLSELYYEMRTDDVEYQSYITPQFVCKKMDERLDTYQTYHPETSAYVQTVRAYFTEISEGKRTHSGVIVRQLIDSHPYIQLGDIIVEYDNQAITNLESFKAVYQQNMNGQVKILRLENNVLKEITLPTFGNIDIIGFWDITLPEE